LSCAVKINGQINADDSAQFNINASMEPAIERLIRRLGHTPAENSLILDGRLITQSMSQAPGVLSVSFVNTSPTAIQGQLQISKIDEFLSTADGRGFISLERTGSRGRCIITISFETGPDILNLLSPDIRDYLSAIFAPIATGDPLKKNEYLEDVRTFYGEAISNEIARSRIHASITFPATVSKVIGGRASGRQVDFDIPLIDILVLESPLWYEIEWGG